MSLIFQFNSNKVHEMHGNVDFQSVIVTDGFSDGGDTRFIINASTLPGFRVGQLMSCLLHLFPTTTSIELDTRARIFI